MHGFFDEQKSNVDVVYVAIPPLSKSVASTTALRVAFEKRSSHHGNNRDFEGLIATEVVCVRKMRLFFATSVPTNVFSFFSMVVE